MDADGAATALDEARAVDLLVLHADAADRRDSGLYWWWWCGCARDGSGTRHGGHENATRTPEAAAAMERCVWSGGRVVYFSFTSVYYCCCFVLFSDLFFCEKRRLKQVLCCGDNVSVKVVCVFYGRSGGSGVWKTEFIHDRERKSVA